MKKRAVLIYLLVAYLFAVITRFSLYFVASSNEDFVYEGKVISIWTPDAGLYGFYAKKLLEGDSLTFNQDTALGHLLYWVVKLLGVDLDTALFTLPAFLASLIVVPIILIGWELKLGEVGFLSALASSIGMNYYFRTHLGYTDTDILNFVFFFSILYGYIALANRKELLFSLLIVVLEILFNSWYHSALPLMAGLWVFFVGYLLVFDRKNNTAFLGALIALSGLVPVGVGYKLLLASALFLPAYFLHSKLNPRYILALFVVGGVVGAWIGYKYQVFDRAFDYLNKKSYYVVKDKNGEEIRLEATLKTVSEAKGVSPKSFVTYSSGNFFIFLIGGIGLTLLVWRYKVATLLLLPYLIGVFSLEAGVRFTTFAVPVIVFGAVYLFYFLYQKLSPLLIRFLEKKEITKKELLVKTLLFYFPSLTLLGYYLHILNNYNHLLSPFFKQGELAAIKEHLNTPQKGYIITWWDYGWPLWYYTNKRTIIDNGKHHYDNYVVAKTLFSFNPRFVANIDRFFIEEYDKIYPWAVLPYVTKKYHFGRLLYSLYTGKIKLPPKKNEIYYYFDDRIILKLPVIERFSHRKRVRQRAFVWTTLLYSYDLEKGEVKGKGIRIDLNKGFLYAKGKKNSFGRLIFHDGEKIVKSYKFRDEDYVLIIYKNRYIIGAYRYMHSFFFQAFFLNNLDRNIFETLHYSKDAKIFRLKGI
ncbi:MAG: hypothetical protein GXO61_05375 [Epsilonproteobacteria bacterium]|nr:hypothetical protein [Campylobacterota bacterium]